MNIDLFKEWIKEKHCRQMYGNEPYFNHLQRVAQNSLGVYENFFGTPTHHGLRLRLTAIGYAHDVLEDYKYTRVTVGDLYKICRECEFDKNINGIHVNPHIIVEPVMQLTRPNTNYDIRTYYSNMDFHAVVVKMADVCDNWKNSMAEAKAECKKNNRLDKYSLSLHVLTHRLQNWPKHLIPTK